MRGGAIRPTEWTGGSVRSREPGLAGREGPSGHVAVAAKQPPEPFVSDDFAVAGRITLWWRDQLVAETLLRPVQMIVLAD